MSSLARSGADFERLVQVVHVGLVVLVVVDLHRLGVDVRLEGVERVGQGRQGERHDATPGKGDGVRFRGRARPDRLGIVYGGSVCEREVWPSFGIGGTSRHGVAARNVSPLPQQSKGREG